MKFLVITKATKDSEAGKWPTADEMLTMGKYIEESVKAGVLLTAEGVHASSKGARVKFSGTKRTVTDGPFTETKELIAGFFVIQVRSKEEAIEWVKRLPIPVREDPEIEIRQIAEAEELGPSSVTPEVSEQLGRVHELAAQQATLRGDAQAAAEFEREAQKHKRHAKSAGAR